MAHPDPFDVATPADTDDASQGDDRIRELKRALGQRLSQVLVGWPTADPMKIKAHSGLFADRPTTGLEVGQIFFATDAQSVYWWDGAAWQSQPLSVSTQPEVMVGPTSTRPAPPTSEGDKPLRMFFDITTNVLSIWNGLSSPNHAWLEFDLDLLGTAETGGTTTSSLSTSDNGTNITGNVAAGTNVETEVIIGPTNKTQYPPAWIPAQVRARIKTASAAWDTDHERWAYGPGSAIRDIEAGELEIKILQVYSKPGTTFPAYARYFARINIVNYNATTNIDYEAQVYITFLTS